MRWVVVFYTFCLCLRLIDLSPTKRSLKGRRIVGGEDADETKYPYIVRLQLHTTFYHEVFVELRSVVRMHKCTGAVIKPTWTLTAAHCVDKYVFIEDRIPEIDMGELKIKSIRPVIKTTDLKYKLYLVIISGPLHKATISTVIYYVIHPSYKNRLLDTINDIALIRNKQIRLNQYARISSLDYATTIGQEVVMAGYGITNGTFNSVPVGDDTSVLNKPLQVLNALIVSCDKMEHVYVRGGLCIARRCAKLSGACPGDSGGPLLHPSGVVGLLTTTTAEGHKLCYLEPYTPFYEVAGITPTSPYLDWISSTIENGVHRNNETMIEDSESIPVNIAHEYLPPSTT